MPPRNNTIGEKIFFMAFILDAYMLLVKLPLPCTNSALKLAAQERIWDFSFLILR